MACHYDDILRLTGLRDSAVQAVYPYGSRVYGTTRPGSDHDYIVVAEGCGDDAEFSAGDLNVHTCTPKAFQQDLDLHEVHAVECAHLPDDMLLVCRARPHFVLNRERLRREFSAKTSNSWVKCRKKLTVEVDQQWIGVKSLFHALRITAFGIQIARDGSISDFGVTNPYWLEIRAMAEAMERDGSWAWEPFNTRFKPIFNGLMTEFRKLAPLEN